MAAFFLEETPVNLIRGQYLKGAKHMDISAFDTRSMDEYAAEARAAYGHTDAYKEYQQRFLGKSAAQQNAAAQGMMALLTRFGAHLGEAPESPDVQALVAQLQSYVTKNFYTCTDEILASYANMYDGDGRFTRNIDDAGGKGTAALAAAAIRHYVSMN